MSNIDFPGVLSELEESINQLDITPNEQGLEDASVIALLLLEVWDVLDSELRGRLNRCITRLMDLGGKVSLACAVGLFVHERRGAA